MYPCFDLDCSGEHSPHAHAHDRAIAATLMKAVYGLDITEEYIQLFADAFSSSDILLNGSILDFLPVLARVPRTWRWLPGTAFLRRLAYYREAVPAMRDVPWRDAKAAIVRRCVSLLLWL